MSTISDIVANSDRPARALEAFIGQELESAGFEVRPPTNDGKIFVMFGRKWLEVRVTGMWA